MTARTVTDDPLGDAPSAPCRLCGPDQWVTVVKDSTGLYIGNDPNATALLWSEFASPTCTVVDEAHEPGVHFTGCGCPTTTRTRAATTMVYPCPNCLPKMFLRWEHGCYRLGHHGCDTCQPER